MKTMIQYGGNQIWDLCLPLPSVTTKQSLYAGSSSQLPANVKPFNGFYRFLKVICCSGIFTHLVLHCWNNCSNYNRVELWSCGCSSWRSRRFDYIRQGCKHSCQANFCFQSWSDDKHRFAEIVFFFYLSVKLFKCMNDCTCRALKLLFSLQCFSAF